MSIDDSGLGLMYGNGAADGSTNSRRQEDPLEAGALQSAIFNSANFSSIATDAKGVIQIFNVGAERMLGYTAAEVMNKITPADISDPQEVVARAKELSAQLGTPIAPGFEALVFKASRGIEDIYELTYIRKDGSRFPAVVSVTALRDAQEAIIGYLLIGTDNTARKKIEEERMKLDQSLRDQQFYTRSLIESNIDAIMTTDPQGIITDINKQMEALTGRTRDELIGAPCKNFFTDQERAEASIKLALTEGKVTNYELTARSWDGRETVVSYNATTFYDRDRRLRGVFAAARDITESKRMDQVLQEAKEAAIAANRAKSAFLATMSHEIRTPMNGVIGMVEVLAHSKLSVEHADAIRTIRDSAFSLLHIIDDILDFSKIEAGHLELERTRVSITDTVEGVFSSLAALADKKGVDTTLFVDPEVPEVIWSDPTRLRQILYNLMGNAIKFSGGHSGFRGRVAVRVEVTEAEPPRLVFSVADTGIGMTPETVCVLFTPFTQAKVSTTRKYGGTGLGLAICKRLVDLMDGAIGVISTPGEGSTFTVTFPLEVAAGSPAVSWQDLSGLECILVASQDYDAGDLRIYLANAGARVQIAADLKEAAELAQSLAEPVVIQDTGKEKVLLAEFAGSAAALTGARHLLITRGQRPRSRMLAPGVVALDLGGMRRRGILRAVAVAVGRTSAEIDYEQFQDDPLQKTVPAKSVAESRRQGELILVAEDDEVNQKVILRQLNMLGYAAEIANTGTEALRMWRAGGYAMVLTDLDMPELDGYGLTQAIREEETGQRKTPILAYTANALRGEETEALSRGMDAYLTKPLQLSLLKNALEKWMPIAARPGTPANAAAATQEAGAAEETPQLVDVAMLKSVMGDDPETMRELLSEYLDSAHRRAGELRTALASGNLRQVGTIGHKLKSSSRSVGAMGLGDLCAELENAGRGENRPAIAEGMACFETTFKAVEAEILRLLREI